MKLNLGENIKNLRKNADMTQEQLADRLGVSFQSVSRWENGGTYPDLELIPAIAEIFSVSTDTLLGIPEHLKEEKASITFDSLRREALRGEIDTDAVIELIRDIRRNYIESSSMWRFWGEGNERCYSLPEILPEVRLTAEAYLDICKDAFNRNLAVQTMAHIEEEERLDEFLESYAPAYDITQCTLKMERYGMREEWDKFDAERRINLFLMIDNLCDSRNFTDRRITDPDPMRSFVLSRFQLDTLNRFCGLDSDSVHPISGNGELDFWIEIRLLLGFRHACHLTALGKTEEAFLVLEDCTSLLERIIAIEDPTELTCTSPWLNGLVWTAEPNWFNINNNPDGKEEYNIWIHAENGATYMIYPSVYYGMLTNPQWFDPIRDDERYVQIVSRVKSLIRYKDKAK